MKKIDVNKLIRMTRKAIIKNAPAIYTAIGIGGVITTVALTITGTIKAVNAVEEEIERINEDPNVEEPVEKLEPVELIKTTWKYYIPAAVTLIVSIGCLAGANTIHAKRNAALVTAYKMSETAYSEYRAKTKELVGDKKEREIRDAVNQDRADKIPESSLLNVIVTGDGDTMFVDYLSGRNRTFKSSIDKLRKVENELNKRMLTEHYISLNDLYYEIGIDTVPGGDDLGWNIDREFIDLSLDMPSAVVIGNTPCIILTDRIGPRYDYDYRYH